MSPEQKRPENDKRGNIRLQEAHSGAQDSSFKALMDLIIFPMLSFGEL